VTRIFLLFAIAVSSPVLAEELPVPPIPPASPPGDVTAPVPDLNAQAPFTPTPEQVSVAVRMYRSKAPDPSRCFAPGSRYESTEDRNPIQTPGFSVSVPLR
jgi:hypothetical protein